MPLSPAKKRLQLYEGNGRATSSVLGERKNRMSQVEQQIGGSSVGSQPLESEQDLIGRIGRDIEALGLVGEADASLLIYLVYTSRLLDDPLAIIMRGLSSSGKSVLQRRVLQMFPSEDVIDVVTLTAASLFNGPEDCLEHKILALGERKHSTDDQTRDQNAMIRQLLSEQRISRWVNVRGEGGWQREHQVLKGPIAYAETTTSKSIFEEDLNRMLQVYTNDSVGQTRRVMQTVAEKYEREQATVDMQVVLDKHRKFQQALEPHTIRIPYAKILTAKMPAEQVRARRVVTQVMATIEAVALLHQFQREKEGGYLIATQQDYTIARRLLLRPLHDSIGVGSIFRKYKQLRKGLKKREFDSNQAGKAGGFKNRQTRKRNLDKLQALGVIELVAKGKGNKSDRWRWTGKSPDELVLPSVHTVFA